MDRKTPPTPSRPKESAPFNLQGESIRRGGADAQVAVEDDLAAVEAGCGVRLERIGGRKHLLARGNWIGSAHLHFNEHGGVRFEYVAEIVSCRVLGTEN